MANPTAAPIDSYNLGGQSRRGPYVSELWELTGSSSGIGTTVAITPRHIKTPVGAVGPVGYAVSGQVITLTLLADLTSQKTTVEIFGRA